jgi:hypothetical protein
MIAKNHPCIYEKHDVGCESRRFHQEAAKSAKRSNGATPTLLNDKREQDTKMLGVNFSNIAYGSARFALMCCIGDLLFLFRFSRRL